MHYACVKLVVIIVLLSDSGKSSGFWIFPLVNNNFAGIAQPLTELTKKHVPNLVLWTGVHQQAFEELKTCLCEATKLHVITYGKPCGILVDASSTRVGSCLIQWTDNGQEKPIAFASAKLTPSQTIIKHLDKSLRHHLHDGPTTPVMENIMEEIFEIRSCM